MSLTPELSQALDRAVEDGRGAYVPEDAVQRPNGRSWRRNPGRRTNHNQRPRVAQIRREHGRVHSAIVVMTADVDLARYLAAQAEPAVDWAEARALASWFRRTPNGASTNLSLQEVHGDCLGSFPGVKLQPGASS